MLSVVLAYHYNSAAKGFLSEVAGWKQRLGYAFTIPLTAIAGAFIPETLRILLFQRGAVRRENMVDVLFAAPFWGFMGACVDAFYRFQGFCFGEHASFGVLLKKVAVDQLLYTPLFGTPAVVVGYHWKRSGFSFVGWCSWFTPSFYKRRILPSLFANWAVWIPAVTIIYSLPSALQIPLFALATSFWSMLVTYITLAQHRVCPTSPIQPTRAVESNQ